jgi:hypothetical protein
MQTEVSILVSVFFVAWGFYERYDARYREQTVISKNFDGNLFIAVGAIILSAALYSSLT